MDLYKDYKDTTVQFLIILLLLYFIVKVDVHSLTLMCIYQMICGKKTFIDKK